MRADVVSTPAEAASGPVGVVVDLVRATSTDSRVCARERFLHVVPHPTGTPGPAPDIEA